MHIIYTDWRDVFLPLTHWLLHADGVLAAGVGEGTLPDDRLTPATQEAGQTLTPVAVQPVSAPAPKVARLARAFVHLRFAVNAGEPWQVGHDVFLRGHTETSYFILKAHTCKRN